MVAIAPAFTNGLPVCDGISTTADTELNARPVGSAADSSNTLAAPRSCIASASVNTLEIDWIENRILGVTEH